MHYARAGICEENQPPGEHILSEYLHLRQDMDQTCTVCLDCAHVRIYPIYLSIHICMLFNRDGPHNLLLQVSARRAIWLMHVRGFRARRSNTPKRFKHASQTLLLVTSNALRSINTYEYSLLQVVGLLVACGILVQQTFVSHASYEVVWAIGFHSPLCEFAQEMGL